MADCDKTGLLRALIDDCRHISVYFTTPIDCRIAEKISFYSAGRLSNFTVKTVSDNRAILHTEELDVKKIYYVKFDSEKIEAIPYGILDSDEFVYGGDDLGVTYSKDSSIFKVYAPTANKVVLNIYDTPESGDKKSYELVEGPGGVWRGKINGDLLGKFYSYNCGGASASFDINRELVDPYAKCVIRNSRRAMIIDETRYPKAIESKSNININEHIIYEIHVRDVSIDQTSGTSLNSGLYKALAEEGTRYANSIQKITTITDHFKELGVTTIQIMPLSEFDNNESPENGNWWGYMPNFFNTPYGGYSSNWRDDTKIFELKEAINSLHNSGFNVTLDVVYNHTAEGFIGEEVHSFNGFVPFYYYRFAHSGHISNGSGCGNEFRSEAPMGRKFILDSLKYWTRFYGFDGYRFDLMGLIDLDTIKILIEELAKIKKDIFIYGEPWTGGVTPISPTYKGAQKNLGFSVFNDDFRDAIKGGVFNPVDKGYIQTKGQYYTDRVIQGILGSINTFSARPQESINYVEIHDNNALFDKLYFSITENREYKEPDQATLDEITKYHKLAAFILLTSQGIPILHLGQDFMRTKFGVENSYNSGDKINKIDWSRKLKYFDVFSYYKNLIELRKGHPIFRIDNEADLREAIEFHREIFPCDVSHCIGYTLQNSPKIGDSFDKFFIVINPYPKEVIITLNEGGWRKLLVGDEYFLHKNIVKGDFVVPPLSGAVYYKQSKGD
ncbi:MAG TPA: type I pullulanase [Spirochaetota bacterium]|nr:type I pullulanase [Spirochaetota bacterium]HOS32778.1 type I pullulanase [Spirochaetota bacterium]HOS56420.1 type I pullulanase [Spirochaetota bacterium]HQF76628.1 type I pullulanase [Spirochaetota bacterium]